MKRRAFTLVAAIGIGHAAPLWAACGSSGGCACTISTTSVSFGTYNPQNGAPNDSVGTIAMACVGNNLTPSTYILSLNGGVSGSVAARTLRSGANVLQYNLYKNAARTILWGDDTGGGASIVDVRPPGNGFAKQFTVYARVPAHQNVAAGGYRDTITVTLSY